MVEKTEQCKRCKRVPKEREIATKLEKRLQIKMQKWRWQYCQPPHSHGPAIITRKWSKKTFISVDNSTHLCRFEYWLELRVSSDQAMVWTPMELEMEARVVRKSSEFCLRILGSKLRNGTPEGALTCRSSQGWLYAGHVNERIMLGRQRQPWPKSSALARYELV